MNRRDILKRYHSGELTRDEALAELTALKIPPKAAQSILGLFDLQSGLAIKP